MKKSRSFLLVTQLICLFAVSIVAFFGIYGFINAISLPLEAIVANQFLKTVRYSFNPALLALYIIVVVSSLVSITVTLLFIVLSFVFLLLSKKHHVISKLAMVFTGFVLVTTIISIFTVASLYFAINLTFSINYFIESIQTSNINDIQVLYLLRSIRQFFLSISFYSLVPFLIIPLVTFVLAFIFAIKERKQEKQIAKEEPKIVMAE